MVKLSIFDLLTFILPGSIAFAIVNYLNENIFKFDFSVVSTNNQLIDGLLLVFLVYLIGLSINQLRTQIPKLWAKTSDSYILPLIAEKNQYRIKEFSMVSKQYLGMPLLKNEVIDRQVADQLYVISFKLLEQEGRLDSTLNLRIQAFFLENTKTVMIISALISIILLLLYPLHLSFLNQSENTIALQTVTLILSLAGAFLFDRIAKTRWKRFYNNMWLNFYAYYRNKNINYE